MHEYVRCGQSLVVINSLRYGFTALNHGDRRAGNPVRFLVRIVPGHTIGIRHIIQRVIQYWDMDDLDIEGCAIKASEESKGIVHPLRKIVDGRKMPTNPDKELLTLSVGKVGNYISRLYHR